MGGGALLEILPGRGQDRRVGQQVRRRAAEDPGSPEEALVPDGGAAAAHILPAVAGRPGREAEGGELGRGREPAHIPHVGGAGGEILAAVIGQEEIIQVLLPVLAEGAHLPLDLRVLLRPKAGEPLGNIGFPQGFGIGPLLRGIFRQGQGAHILIEAFFQRRIGQGVGRAVHKDALEARLRHEGGALGDPVHPFLEGQGIRHIPAADHIEHAGLRLHHVGRDAAPVDDGVVDPCLVLHMLPQELDADVHQLHSVQGAAPVLRVPGGVGGHAFEPIEHLGAGIVGAGGDLVGIAGVPAEGRVQLLPDPLPGEESLGRAPLLPGAAVKDHGSGKGAPLQESLHAAGGGEGGGPQHIMAAAVACPAGLQGPGGSLPRRLAEAAQCIELPQNADHRPAGAEGAGEGGGDAAQVFPDGKALGPELFHIKGGGAVFLEAQLRIFPDLMGKGGEFAAPSFDIGLCFLFRVHINTTPCSEIPWCGGSGAGS